MPLFAASAEGCYHVDMPPRRYFRRATPTIFRLFFQRADMLLMSLRCRYFAMLSLL